MVVQFGLAAGYAAVGTWYGIVLGGTPGTPEAPTALAEHARAYTAASLVLAALAVATSVLCWRRDAGVRAIPPPAVEAPEAGFPEAGFPDAGSPAVAASPASEGG
jgi:hypothetical protein